MNKEEIMEILRALAEKFGTTTEFLWTVMIKQSYVTGITHTLTFALSLVCIIFWNLIVWHKNFQDTDNADLYIVINFGKLFGVFASVMWVFIFLATLVEVVTSLINPEYWVLKQVFGGLGK
jgi:uncharacterized membrane protein YhaH (DUF805 family)